MRKMGKVGVDIIEVKRVVPAILGIFVIEDPITTITSPIKMELFTNIKTIAKTITPEINCITAIIRLYYGLV